MPTHPTDSIRKTSSNNLNRQVAQYSLAAAVAGVSMLALVTPAAGEVLVTKKSISIPPFGAGTPVPIDLNHDGIPDFTFYNSYSFGSAQIWMKGGGVVVAKSSRGILYAAALMRGAEIGPSAQFESASPYPAGIERGYGVESGGSDRLLGNWGGNPKNRYLGVRFQIKGQTHYGWVRLTVITEPGSFWSATITGYAYETVPNKKIKAGTAVTSATETNAPNATTTAKCPSLGMLTQGAEGLPLWRGEGIPVR